jgi:hypothetical protein
MPLNIQYRPVILSPQAIASPVAGMARPVTENERPRDFHARIRKRDNVSVRRALQRPGEWRKRLGGIAAIAALGMLLGPIGWGNPGGIDPAQARERVTGLRPFERAGDSFPGSAFYYLASDDTGLIAPDAAAQAWATHRDDETFANPASPAGPAARPLIAQSGFENQARALECLTAAIYYEAASEPDGGQRAVAQVVLNRVAHPAFPHTVCGVVYQGSERPSCQFSFACDGSMARRPVAQFWDRARRVAADALAGYVYAPVGLATHYHTSAVHPYWADSLAFIGTIGAHRFYRWSGAAGRPAAFNAVYAGIEPLAGPHPRTWTPAPADVADPLALAKAYEEGRIAAVQAASLHGAAAVGAAPQAFGQAPLPHTAAPAFSASVQERGGDAVYRAAPMTGTGSGAIRPEFENAGKWIAQPTS